MPRWLAKGTKRKWVRIGDAIVSLTSGCYAGHEFRLKYINSRHSRLARPEPAKDLVAVVASHSCRSKFARFLAYVERGGPADVGTAVRQEYGPFREMGKSGQKIRTRLNHVMW